MSGSAISLLTRGGRAPVAALLLGLLGLLGLAPGLAPAAASAPEPASVPPSGGLVMAGGPAAGFYQEVAEGVAARVPNVRTVATKGSVENLDLLVRRRVRFALAQQDVVSERFRAARAAGRDAGVRVVGRVFFDDLHILVRSPLHVERAGEFRWLRIWPGEEGTRPSGGIVSAP